MLRQYECPRCLGTGLEPNAFDIPQTSMDPIEEMKYRDMDRLAGRRLIEGRLYYANELCSLCDGRRTVLA